MKKFPTLQELTKCDRCKVSKCYWKIGTDRLAQCRVAMSLQFSIKLVSVKSNKARCDKTMYACILYEFARLIQSFSLSNVT